MAEIEVSINGERDWSLGLPKELLNLIAKKLPDPFDFVHFRAVCRSWKSSVRYSDHSPEFPWLLDFSQNDTYVHSLHDPIGQLRFYSIHSGKTLAIPIQEYSGWLRGACYHYIPFYEFGALTLFNPLADDKFVHARIHLPSASSPWMVWTGAGPICDRNILIVDHGWNPEEKGRWIFYDPQRRNWTEHVGFFRKFCYWQGMLFSDNGRKVKVFDISSKALLYKISYPENEMWDQLDYERYFYLVESSGEILSVYWLRNCQQPVEESMVYIYRLDLKGKDGKPCWVRIRDIGDQILFLEVRNGFSMTDELKGGRIYFIDPGNGKPYVHDVVAGTVERLPCPFTMCTWFIPSLY